MPDDPKKSLIFIKMVKFGFRQFHTDSREVIPSKISLFHDHIFLVSNTDREVTLLSNGSSLEKRSKGFR